MQIIEREEKLDEKYKNQQEKDKENPSNSLEERRAPVVPRVMR